jgi:cell division protein FtsZ
MPQQIAEPVNTTSVKVDKESTDSNDVYKRTRERLELMKRVNGHFSNPQALNEMEREPAYKRKNVKLENVLASDDTNYSRYSLNSDADKNPAISKNNKFLHDRPD